ncbi:MAG: hypothetical protein KDC54_13835 [Lewinella sp.]|nr:hypothetical protein [Lewinella sp.]
MIIIWSWLAGPYGEASWRVAGARHAGDRVICRDWPASASHLGQLEELAAQARTTGEVMILLHRQHGYSPAERQQLQQMRSDGYGAVRCFQFGEGSGPIYLTNNPRGLLGTHGTFSARVAYTGDTLLSVTAVADETARTLKAAHFSAIWQRFQHAWRALVFELREDLLQALVSTDTPGVVAPGAFYQWLRQDARRVLLLRLLSLAGRLRVGSALHRELLQQEAETERSLLFPEEGCASFGPAAVEARAQLAQLITKDLMATGNEVTLRQIRESFTNLLDTLPGPTYV